MLIRHFAAYRKSHRARIIIHSHYISSPLRRLSHRALIIAHIHTASWTFRHSHALRYALAIRGSQARSLPASLAVQLNHGTPFLPKGLRPNLHKRLPLLSPPARGRAYLLLYCVRLFFMLIRHFAAS